MNYPKIFLSQYYGTIKSELWFICILNVGAGRYLCNLLPMNGLLISLVTLLLGCKTVVFMNSASVMPSITSDFDRYSWKYFQSLPLGKKDLILALVSANFLCRLPALVWLLSFLQTLAYFSDGETTILSWSIYLKCFLAGVPLLVIISNLGIDLVIVHPRRKHSTSSSQDLFLVRLKSFIVGRPLVLYGAYALYWLSSYNKTIFVMILTVPFAFMNSVIQSWLLAPILAGLSYYLFNSTLKTWQDEKIGYVKNTWNRKRDVPLMAICLCLLIYPLLKVDLETPSYYAHSPLMKAVHQKDQKLIELLISQGADVNLANEKGFTPLMAAAHEGDLEMFIFLEKRGARYHGEVKLSASDYHHGMNIFLMAVDGHNPRLVEYLLQKGYNPNQSNSLGRYDAVHLAATACSSGALDLLIQHKADLKTLNKEGLTPMHVAVKRNCLGNVVSLVDAGVDPGLKDANGRLAMEYVVKGKKQLEIENYLSRRARLPAGK